MRSCRAKRFVLILLVVGSGSVSHGYAQNPNPIQAENALPGTPGWELANPAVNHEIEGYASLTSVLQGNPIDLFVNTSSPSYRLEIFRMGWYEGIGARRIFGPETKDRMPQRQCPEDPRFGLIECDWQPSVTVTPGPDWVSGYYLAKLTTTDTGRDAYIIFVVRDDRVSDFLMQASVTTWQAYNPWPGRNGDDPDHTSFGKSLYDFNSNFTRPTACVPAPQGIRACKVSFNRPYALGAEDASAPGLGAGEFLTNLQLAGATPSGGWEYNMVRFLEQHGYDVTYCTDVDTHERGDRILPIHKGFLSVGHDEYWSSAMRANVRAARDRPLFQGGGVNLAFFSANTCYWQIRFEASAAGAQDRTIVGYKDDFRDDPKYVPIEAELNEVTFTWGPGEEFGWVPPPPIPPDPPVNRAQDRSEEELLGIAYVSNNLGDFHDIVISNVDTWVTAGTQLQPNDHLRGLLGYEVDGNRGEGVPPVDEAGLVVIAESPFALGGISKMTFYTRRDTNAIVFATGTIQWSWGLDDYPPNTDLHGGTPISQPAQIITQNVLNQFLR